MLRSVLQASVLPVFAAALVFGAGPAAAEILTYVIDLSGAQQVPPLGVNGSGRIVATFDTDARTLSWAITYSGLSGRPTAAHFHGPAELGVNAGVAVLIPDPLTSPIVGSTMLTAEQAAQFVAGLWYLNIHTGANGAGEIRGQMVLPPAAPAP